MDRRVAACIGLFVPALVSAQTGGGSSCCQSITPYVRAAIGTTHEEVRGASRHEWLSVIVLWRSATVQNGGTDHADALTQERTRAAATVASHQAGRDQFGGVFGGDTYQYAELSRRENRLWVLGQEYHIPVRDSAIVVMVDGIDQPAGSSVVGVAYIPAEMPDGYWSKMWTSGDTTFMVHPSRNSGAMLETALRSSPVIRQFLDGSSRH